MRNVRQVTKSVEPKTQAVWTLGRLSNRLNEWADEIYDTTSHPSLGQSPREAFAQGLLRTGRRPQRLIAYDEEFLMWTRPTTRKGTAMVMPGRGIKIHHLLYWCEAFRHPQVERTRVAVRYDPYDAGRAWACVNHRWFELHSEYYAIFRGRSEKELMLAVEELRARRSQHSRQFYASAKQLGAFLQSVGAEESLLRQRRCDREARRLVSIVEGDLSAPEDDHEERAERLGAEITRSSPTIEAIADQREEYEEF